MDGVRRDDVEPVQAPETPWPLPERPGFLMRRLHQIHVSLFSERCGVFRVTPLQYSLLSLLAERGEADQTTLAHAVALDRTTTTGALKRLEARELVERSPAPTDRRSQRCRLTLAGNALLHRMEEAARQAHDATLAPLSAEEQTTLIRLMKKITAAHQQRQGADGLLNQAAARRSLLHQCLDEARGRDIAERLRDGRERIPYCAARRLSMAHHHEHDDHHHDAHHGSALSPMELRVRALESVLVEKGYVDPAALDALIETYETKVGPHNGARVVARAWVDPGFRARLLADATPAIRELGVGGRGGEHMVVVANTPDEHNLVVCTLCSCYPWPVLGLPPVWYKSPPYRSRAVIEPRAVLAEFGVALPPTQRIRVWDSTAELRYMVLPMRPAGTEGFDEAALAALVTRDSMIGTGLPREPGMRP